MSRKIKILSGKEVSKILIDFGFVEKRTSGSHTRFTLSNEEKEDLHVTVPLHKELKRGTLKGIISELEKYFSEEDINSNFYTL